MRSRAKKRSARARQEERRELVHAAGCVHRGCASKWFLDMPEWLKDPELGFDPTVRVPRSLRPFFAEHGVAHP